MLTKTVKTLSCLWGVPLQHLSLLRLRGAARLLSACFRIMELCHILFKVRLIRGDSEPLICCHNADVFILSVTMALLCVGLPRAHCTQGWLVNQGPDSNGETRHKTKPCVRLDRVKPVTLLTLERCSTAGDTDLAGSLWVQHTWLVLTQCWGVGLQGHEQCCKPENQSKK